MLAMSDARGLQDDQPFDLLVEPLAGAGRLEVLRINRCMGLQLSIEGECAALAGCAGLSRAVAGTLRLCAALIAAGGCPALGCLLCCDVQLMAAAEPSDHVHHIAPTVGPFTPPPCLLACLLSSDVGALLEGKPHFRKLEFTADMLSDPEDLVQLRRRFPRVGGE